LGEIRACIVGGGRRFRKPVDEIPAVQSMGIAAAGLNLAAAQVPYLA
jgi:hypothetical protein